ncbi:MAG TPA: thioesterase domain-containing protein, partial [Pyrinomonadaceae bacterium]
GAGGNVFSFAELARRLGPAQPFYGLQARGLDGVHAPQTRVEDMAAHYVEAVRTVQPEGPYLLGGWSMGGAVAFEMARQLQEQGQAVALLALLDAPAPTAEDAQRADDELALLAAFAQDVGLPLDRLALSAEDLQLAPRALMAHVLQAAQAADLMPPDVDLAQIELLFAVFKANVLARRGYSPRAHSFPLALLRASEPAGDDAGDESLGWNDLTAGAAEICRVPGDHYSMLREPHVGRLAEELEARLARAHEVTAGGGSR